MSNTTINIGGKMFTFIDSSKLVDKKEEKQIGFSLEKCMEILSQTEITRTDLNITQEELEEEEQDIYLNCFFCELEIIRDSEEHDICHITREGDLCCEDCLSCCDCELCEKEEPQFNMCCGCGKFNDTRPMCDCGSSHRENCSDCEKKEEKVLKPWAELKQKLQTLTKDELYDFIHE